MTTPQKRPTPVWTFCLPFFHGAGRQDAHEGWHDDDDGRRWTTMDDDGRRRRRHHKKNWTHPPYGHHVSRFFMGRGDRMHTSARKTTTTEPPVTSCFPFFHGAGKQAAQGGGEDGTPPMTLDETICTGGNSEKGFIQLRADRSEFWYRSGLISHHTCKLHAHLLAARVCYVIMQTSSCRGEHYTIGAEDRKISKTYRSSFEFKAPFHSNLNQRQIFQLYTPLVHGIPLFPWPLVAVYPEISRNSPCK